MVFLSERLSLLLKIVIPAQYKTNVMYSVIDCGKYFLWFQDYWMCLIWSFDSEDNISSIFFPYSYSKLSASFDRRYLPFYFFHVIFWLSKQKLHEVKLFFACYLLEQFWWSYLEMDGQLTVLSILTPLIRLWSFC